MNVLQAAEERLALIFRDFDNVLVAFSCGKDSGVLLNLAYRYARENGLASRLGFYYEDYEAGYRYTDEYAERMFSALEVERKFWLCLPISAACSVSMYEPRWIPWDEDKRDIWVRPMPKGPHVINADNCPYPFVKGTKGFDARIQFSEWYAKRYGKTVAGRSARDPGGDGPLATAVVPRNADAEVGREKAGEGGRKREKAGGLG